MGDESCFSPAVSWVFCLRCDQLLTVFVFNWANGTSLTRSFRLPTSEFGLLCSVNWENNHFCVLSRLVSPKHEHESFPKTYLSWANPALVHMWTTLSKSQMPSRLSLFWARFTHECFFLREDPNVFIEASPREHKEATLGGGAWYSVHNYCSWTNTTTPKGVSLAGRKLNGEKRKEFVQHELSILVHCLTGKLWDLEHDKGKPSVMSEGELKFANTLRKSLSWSEKLLWS